MVIKTIIHNVTIMTLKGFIKVNVTLISSLISHLLTFVSLTLHNIQTIINDVNNVQ